VENQIYVNGFHVDIRRFSWEENWDGTFEADAYYIDYSLGPRVRETHFIHPDPPGETVFLPKGSRFRAHCTPSAHRLLCLTFDDERAVQLFEGCGSQGYGARWHAWRKRCRIRASRSMF
jgi:AraC family transcriptional regulator